MTEPCVRTGELMLLDASVKALTDRLDKNDTNYAKRLEDLGKEISDLGKVYDSIHRLSENVAIIALETKYTKAAVDNITADMKNLIHLPLETEGIKNSVKIIRSDVDEIKQAPVEDARHYKRAFVVAAIGIIVMAFFAGKFWA